MPLDIAALRTEFAKLHTDATSLVSKASEAGKELSAEDKQSKDRMFARMDQIQALVKDEERLAALQFSEATGELPGAPKGKDELNPCQPQKFDAAKYREGVNLYARTGDDSKCRQQFATTTGTQSSIFLPTEILAPVAVRRTANPFRGILAAFGLKAMELDIAATINLPVDDDTANTGASGVAEDATAANADQDPDRSTSISLAGATSYTSKPAWYSNTLVGSLGFDVLSYSLPLLQRRVDKKQEAAWTTKLLAQTVGVTTAATTAITYAEWIAFEHSQSVAYRYDSAYLLADTLLQLLRGMVDDNHRPIVMIDSVTGKGFDYAINGRPIFVGDNMQAVAAAKVVGAIVSAECIKILDAMGARMTRYAAVPARPDQIGFEMFQNGDCSFVAQGVKLLKTHA